MFTVRCTCGQQGSRVGDNIDGESAMMIMQMHAVRQHAVQGYAEYTVSVDGRLYMVTWRTSSNYVECQVCNVEVLRIVGHEHGSLGAEQAEAVQQAMMRHGQARHSDRDDAPYFVVVHGNITTVTFRHAPV